MSPTLLVPSPAMAVTLSPLAQAGVVAVGGACGSMLRWASGTLLNTLPLPIAAGTLAVNLVGGALIGFESDIPVHGVSPAGNTVQRPPDTTPRSCPAGAANPAGSRDLAHVSIHAVA